MCSRQRDPSSNIVRSVIDSPRVDHGQARDASVRGHYHRGTPFLRDTTSKEYVHGEESKFDGVSERRESSIHGVSVLLRGRGATLAVTTHLSSDRGAAASGIGSVAVSRQG